MVGPTFFGEYVVTAEWQDLLGRAKALGVVVDFNNPGWEHFSIVYGGRKWTRDSLCFGLLQNIVESIEKGEALS